MSEREAVNLDRATVVRIMREGAEAAAAGKAATACPYSPAGDATDRVRVQAWLRGFLHPDTVAR